jgi:hypothetical protein
VFVGAFEEIVGRLGSADAGARRVAIHDLIGVAAHEPRANEVLLGHLAREPDEKAALLIIRHLAHAGARETMPALLRMYQDRRTPARVAHAAIVAHDTLAG